MKKLLIIAGATFCCVGAFAQGTIFSINSDNLIYFTTDTTHIATADQSTTWGGTAAGGTFSIAGSSAFTGNAYDVVAGGTSPTLPGSIASLAGHPTFVAALFAGTSSSSLSLQTTTTIDNWDNFNAGGIVSVNANLPPGSGFAAGVPAWFQVQVYDSRYANAAAAWAANGVYGGTSSIFQSTPLGVPDYIYNPASPVNSTWQPGTAVMPDIQAGPLAGDFGGIALYANNVVVPEPGTFALAGLGIAALLVFRRRS